MLSYESVIEWYKCAGAFLVQRNENERFDKKSYYSLFTRFLTRYNKYNRGIKFPHSLTNAELWGFFMPEKALSRLSPTGSCRIGVWEFEIVGFTQDFALNFVRDFAGY